MSRRELTFSDVEAWRNQDGSPKDFQPSDPLYEYDDLGDDGEYEWATYEDDSESEREWERIIELRRQLAAWHSDAGPMSFSPDAPDPREVTLAQEELDELVDAFGDPPPGWAPRPPGRLSRAEVAELDAAAASRDLQRAFEAAVAAELDAATLEHWQWLVAGDKQKAIASRLGVSQPAVVKRERALRARIDEIYRKHFGRPYPWLSVSLGGRPRKS